MKEVFELDVYNLAEKLADKIWDNFDGWPKKTQSTIGYQIIRSADSIGANIAEGFGRFTPKDRKVFYRYARELFEETKCWLRKLIRRNLITAESADNYRNIIDELGPKLNAFINATE